MSTSPFMADMSDDVLIEILVRLSDARAANRCSLVCKRWHSLIISPHFRKTFIQSNQNKIHVGFSILFKSSIKASPLYKLPLKYGSSEPYDLSFMPDSCDLEIKASCGDLLLVMRGDNFLRSSRHYYICNSLTKHWFALPLILFLGGYISYTGSFGYALVLDPRDQSRYMVLVILKSSFKLGKFMVSAAIFDSTTAKWTHHLLDTPYVVSEIYVVAMCPLEVVGLTNKRMLHWVDGGFAELCGVAAFNPFSSDFRLIPLPYAFLCKSLQTGYSKDKVRLGIVQGHLRLSLMLKTNEFCFSFRIWELENDDSWRLVHDITIDTWGVANDWAMLFFVLTFDPNDGNVIFLVREKEVYRYDIVQDVHERLCEFPIQCCGDYKNCTERLKIRTAHYMNVLTSVHPVWPTPIPSLQYHHS